MKNQSKVRYRPFQLRSRRAARIPGSRGARGRRGLGRGRRRAPERVRAGGGQERLCRGPWARAGGGRFPRGRARLRPHGERGAGRRLRAAAGAGRRAAAPRAAGTRGAGLQISGLKFQNKDWS